MLTVILAGGKGTRILEESQYRPKPLIRIGDRPLIRHIMDIYQKQGHHDFLILTGYKSRMFEEQMNRIVKPSLRSEDGRLLRYEAKGYTVTFLDTGEDTGSAGRLMAAREVIGDQTFMLTYGDGLSAVDLNDLIRFHREKGGVVTLTAVHPQPRYGTLDIDENGTVLALREKMREDVPVINGGYMVMEPTVFDYLEETDYSLEADFLTRIAGQGLLRAYLFDGFWQSMDTFAEKIYLTELWNTGNPPWKRK